MPALCEHWPVLAPAPCVSLCSGPTRGRREAESDQVAGMGVMNC